MKNEKIFDRKRGRSGKTKSTEKTSHIKKFDKIPNEKFALTHIRIKTRYGFELNPAVFCFKFFLKLMHSLASDYGTCEQITLMFNQLCH